MTPHINAKKEDIAKTVLMPGDPLRAKYIAETYLENVKLVNTVRNMFIYTGTYKGKKITIAGSGMGQASMSIYSFELFKFYDVDNIIRIGSSGSYKENLKIYEVVLATSAYTDNTAFGELVLGEKINEISGSNELNNKLEKAANDLNIPIHKAKVHSSDVFYAKRSLEKTLEITNADCVEMEAAALFVNAKATGKNAACLLTISDNLITNEETSAEERQTAFNDMIKIALEIT